ncbi:Synaptotagmin-like protein 3 [Tupaia chinensis]|uniref:Synaptotagmin-like protein 3 n=1 Tax=Tupaia chinensis TaxID=246437 RepID=L9K0M2_TUPCH|nr:Synaptotagmin-like protein 3 [Tupaia chinensis]
MAALLHLGCSLDLDVLYLLPVLTCYQPVPVFSLATHKAAMLCGGVAACDGDGQSRAPAVVYVSPSVSDRLGFGWPSLLARKPLQWKVGFWALVFLLLLRGEEMAHGVDLNALKELEREAVLQVLYRDREVQNVEEQRVRKLKAHLQRLRWEGAKSSSQEHREKSCARCQRVLGLRLNRGAVCRGCSHRVCRDCRVFPRRTRTWKCTVCFEDRNVKIKTGEWFFEERAKKFPTEALGVLPTQTLGFHEGPLERHSSLQLADSELAHRVVLSEEASGKHQTAGARLLQSYQKLSKISVVPPTPPPLSESQCSRSPSRLQELGQFKGFNKSMENLFLSVTTHMKKLSKSQSDVTSEKHLLATGSWQCANRTERRSQSDTAVNVTTRGSLISINSTCTEMGNFENANVSGEIEFAIRYCFKTHSLEICIKACKNLAYGEERKKKCNPYVKTYLLPDRSSQGKRKTTVQKNTVDPTFQETLKYQVDPAQLAARRLQVSVWHLGTLARRVSLGEVMIPLATWDFQDSAAQSFRWYPLRAKLTCVVMPPPWWGARSGQLFPSSQPQVLHHRDRKYGEPTPNQPAVVRAPAVLTSADTACLAALRGQPQAHGRDELSRAAQNSGTASRSGRSAAEKCEDGLALSTGELAVRAKLVLPAGPSKPQEAQEDAVPTGKGREAVWKALTAGPARVPYSCLTLPDQQKLRLKSPVLKKQGCPQWKHSFVFDGVSASQLRQSSLELTVWDQALFGVSDRLLGGARLSSRDAAGGVDSCSKLQWQKVLSSPNLWTDMTLVLH